MAKYTSIPTAEQFRCDVTAKPLFGSHRQQRPMLGMHRHNPGNKVIDQLCTLLGEYRRADWSDEALDLLGQIYYVAKHWLSLPTQEEMTRRAVAGLLLVTQDRMCQIFGCALANLDKNMEEYFGKAIYQPAADEDKGNRAEYLSYRDAQKYRLKFMGGRAYMWDWYTNTNTMTRTLANTRFANRTAGNPFDKGPITAGYAGYALCMDGSFYVADHRNNKDARGTFAHSAYAAGKPILCAGEIAIADGQVVAVTNSSGHYRPTVEKLLHVVRCLRTLGVDLRKVKVNVRTDADTFWFNAHEFINNKGTKDGLRPLTVAKEQKLYNRIPGLIEFMENGGMSRREAMHNLTGGRV
jgi:hypothetical protein